MQGWRLQGLDLRERGDALRSLDPQGALLLGVQLDDDDEAWLRERGALLFPVIPELPFDPYRSSLYSPEELYRGIASAPYSTTPDARVYAWSRQQHSGHEAALSKALHDQAIETELDDVLAGSMAVGVMGGHGLDRGTDGYAEAARLGRALTSAGLLVATGGGPGAMEAANLGAFLADEPADALDEAVALLSSAPSFRPSITQWARRAFEVLDRWPGGRASVGIPTWFYGHEPPNPFATQIAKYFQNALREDSLLHRCDAGIVFLPGAAGTVQEIFQDACENYYADEATLAPMVLLGSRYWTEETPAWPLLTALARDRPMAPKLHLVDSVDEAVAAVGD